MKRYASGKEISQVKANDFVPVSDYTYNDLTLRGDQSDYYFSPSKLVFRQEHHDREFFYEATEVGINDRWNPSHVVEDKNKGKMKIEIAFDNIEGEEFVSWLNNKGHDAKIGTSTGSYIDGYWVSSDENANEILRKLWEEYCNG